MKISFTALNKNHFILNVFIGCRGLILIAIDCQGCYRLTMIAISFFPIGKKTHYALGSIPGRTRRTDICMQRKNKQETEKKVMLCIFAYIYKHK
jgi:hypothetical protein